jgi:hypothetical protein
MSNVNKRRREAELYCPLRLFKCRKTVQIRRLIIRSFPAIIYSPVFILADCVVDGKSSETGSCLLPSLLRPRLKYERIEDSPDLVISVSSVLADIREVAGDAQEAS